MAHSPAREAKEIVVDERRRTSLAKVGRKQDRRYLVEEFDDGTLVFTPAVTVTALELAALRDPQLRASLEAARTGDRIGLGDRGSFSRFADDS
ncbi:MAG: hypothetical protein ABR511_02550 [Acidimicrobiales bacterium]